mmetsp:Transcript_86314/g.143002  ORF Transcript_86314/g.143002 Transcript_86314/m.143002 type:complete len:149 (-) Transcript_86314:1276-1722(-)
MRWPSPWTDSQSFFAVPTLVPPARALRKIATTAAKAKPMPNPVVGSVKALAMAVNQPVAASRPFNFNKSFGRRIDGSTAVMTIAAKVAFGMPDSTPATMGCASAAVAKPQTRPANGEAAPVIFATIDLLSEPPTGALPAMPEAMQPMP